MMRRPAVMLAIVAMAAAVWLQQRVDPQRHVASQTQTQTPAKRDAQTQFPTRSQDQPQTRNPTPWPSATPRAAPPAAGGGTIDTAVAQHLHGVSVRGQGRVLRVLPDDTQGSPHQRFLLRMDSGTTVLVAHNIELAPRLDGLQLGDLVEFSGEYEWNPKGGVLHWTHHDPSGHHVAGWLRHAGQLSQ